MSQDKRDEWICLYCRGLCECAACRKKKAKETNTEYWSKRGRRKLVQSPKEPPKVIRRLPFSSPSFSCPPVSSRFQRFLPDNQPVLLVRKMGLSWGSPLDFLSRWNELIFFWRNLFGHILFVFLTFLHVTYLSLLLGYTIKSPNTIPSYSILTARYEKC